MITEHLNPIDLPNWSESFSQVVVVRAGATRTIYVSGQVFVDASNNVVGHGDLGNRLRSPSKISGRRLQRPGQRRPLSFGWASTSKTINGSKPRSLVPRCATLSLPSGCRLAPGSVFLRSLSMRF